MSSGTDDRKSAVAGAALTYERVGARPSDPNIDDISDFFTPTFREVYDTVVFAPPLPVVRIAAAVAIDQDRKIAPDEFLVEF